MIKTERGGVLPRGRTFSLQVPELLVGLSTLLIVLVLLL
jgi:hypothetical protein